MSLLSLSPLLWVLAAHAPAAPPLTLHEGLPEHFKLDGTLDEWAALPSFTLGAAQQVAGKSRVSSPRDLSARLWLALGPEGLAVAGEVHDDHVHLAFKPEQINDDHVEVWIGLPAAQLPVMGFANQFGETEVKTAGACADLPEEDGGGHEECATWWKQQAERRKQLTSAFVVQYGLLLEKAVRYGPQPEQAGRSHYELMPDGYRFEALIPLTAFPRSAQAPLKDLQVMVDLIDNDEGQGKLETFLSSSSRRKFGEASTFNAVRLATPLRQGAWPELFERLLHANKHASYQPGPAVQKFQVWFNPAVGYQQQPTRDSPAVAEVDLAKARDVGKQGDVEVLTVPALVTSLSEPSNWAVSHRGPQLLDTQDLDDGNLTGIPHGQRLLMLRVQEDTVSPLGTGACGSCSHLNLASLRVDDKGHFSKPVVLEDLAFGSRSYTWKASSDLALIEVFTSHEVDDKTKPLPVSRHTWNPKTGEYETQRFEVKDEPGSEDSKPEDSKPEDSKPEE